MIVLVMARVYESPEQEPAQHSLHSVSIIQINFHAGDWTVITPAPSLLSLLSLPRVRMMNLTLALMVE